MQISLGRHDPFIQPDVRNVVIRICARSPMHLDRLRTFRLLSETLHFRRTAEALHLSQSAVSQQVAALEADLRVTLFERIGRRVYLTAAGQVLAAESSKVLASIDRAREAVAAVGAGDRGRLRIGASTTPGIYLVPEVLGRFRAALPAVELQFRIANSAAIEAALVANDLDLGVIGEEKKQDDLFHVVLGQDQVVAVAAPSLIGRMRSLSPKDLARLPVLAREAGSATQGHVDQALAELGIRVSPAFELPSPEAQLRAAAAGLGVAFVSRHAAATELSARRLVQLPVRGLKIVRPLIAAYHRDKRFTPAMKELVRLLQARLRGSRDRS
jgi:DNA-binding transcriptional LysR family regulator